MTPAPQSPRASFSQIIGRALVVLVPLLIGLGAGYFHLQVRQQIRDQETVEQFGFAVVAQVVKTDIRNSPPSGSTAKSTGAKQKTCQATFRYSPPGGKAIITKQLLAAPLSICQRYKAGDSTKVWVVPTDNRIFMLEGDKINPLWSWASLFIFLIFCGFAIVLFRKMLRIRKSGATTS